MVVEQKRVIPYGDFVKATTQRQGGGIIYDLIGISPYTGNVRVKIGLGDILPVVNADVRYKFDYLFNAGWYSLDIISQDKDIIKYFIEGKEAVLDTARLKLVEVVQGNPPDYLFIQLQPMGYSDVYATLGY